ncbi:hypothetical protein KIH74_19170 [Kineosporia sp. J2-2]|uniref:DUF6504 domain-containing protein n=2 Tax=Kineosporia corallincola TaxID=2835133 RepID=A0ABS5TNA5_9ACTN|nr:hypothetical protein [Kineosporia corallincola]
MAFLWRGRLYVVREVLGHWRERRDWWSTAAARALHGESWADDRPPAHERPSFAVWSGGSAGSSGEMPGGVPGPVPDWSCRAKTSEEPDKQGSTAWPEAGREHPVDSECEVWRVEASTGRAFGAGVYDLSYTPAVNPSADSWRLLQVAD